MKTLFQIIKDAEKQSIALGHFNFSVLEQLKGFFEAVKEKRIPIIAAVSEKERNFLGTDLAKQLVDYYNRLLGEKLIFFSADHCRSFDSIKEAAESGYELIVADFSELSLEENIEKTAEAVKISKSVNPDILVEGELGHLPGQSKILEAPPETFLINSLEAESFVQKTKIDLLAPAVGNFHGKVLNFSPKIEIDLLSKVKESARIPLVLHGGSGISEEDIKKSILNGISVIHFSTDIREAWKRSLEQSLEQNKEELAPYKILSEVVEAVKKNIEGKIDSFS